VKLAHTLILSIALPRKRASSVESTIPAVAAARDHGLEFGSLIENGMTPAQALLVATRNAADLLGAADRVGSVQAGR
jgi:N-acetylglucosamine-6-phosphate deacetylase